MNEDDLAMKRDRIASLADQAARSPETVDLSEIIESLSIDKQPIRDLAVTAFVEVLVSQDIMTELVNQLEGADSELRQETCRALAAAIRQYPDCIVVPRDLSALFGDGDSTLPDDENTLNAHILFGKLATTFPSDIIPLLIEFLTDDNYDVRSAAVHGLTTVVPEYSEHISPMSFPIIETLRGGGFLLVMEIMIQYPAEMIPRVVATLTLPEFEEEAAKIGLQFNSPFHRSRLIQELEAIDDYKRQKRIIATVPFLADLLTASATIGDEFDINGLSSDVEWADELDESGVRIPSGKERDEFGPHLLWLIADLLSIVTEAYPAMMGLKSDTQ